MGKTIRDVATHARVSITTVSHVINNTRFVSDELRDRVQRAIDELDYHPNEIARGLRRGDTMTIGLILPDNSNPFFAEVARLIADIGFENGYSVILCNSAGEVAREAAYVSTLIAKQVDGIIFIAAHSDYEHLRDLQSRRIPVVVVDRDITLALGDVVLVNNEQGGYLATQHLLDLGHRRIACITGPSELNPSADRVKGYRRALLEAGLPPREAYVVAGDFSYQSGEGAMERLLALDERPSAVFVCNDMMAIGSKRSLSLASLDVPADISLVGFDDIEFASAVSPALTTVAQPVKEMAETATALLIDRIQRGDEPRDSQRIVLDTQLVVRDSCRAFTEEG